MYIIGISDSLHDRSVCLLENAEIVSAIEEERLTRVKHCISKGKIISAKERRANIDACIDYCLETRGITRKQIDDLYISSLYKRSIIDAKRISHHLAHAASAFYPSHFEEAAILVVDGAGESVEEMKNETISFGYGIENGIEIKKQVSGDFIAYQPILMTQNSLGMFYKIVSLILGMGRFGAGKVMGLASYGKENHKLSFLEKYIHYNEEGEVKIDNYEIYQALLRYKADVIGKEANPETQFQLSADLALKAQVLTENILISISRFLYRLTKSKNLCLAGGVALNSVANFRILEETAFENVFIQPASGDNGLSFGAAYWGYYADKKMKREKTLYFSPYLGKIYSNEEILNAYHSLSRDLRVVELQEEAVLKAAAEYLSQEKIIGWFQDQSEMGPRALGNRSILADPRKAENKDIVNARVKHRESFRPFAPAVLEEFSSEYFEFNGKSPYMLLVPKVKINRREQIPAVTHVDGTARLQTVSAKQNKKFYQLISEFHKLTGVPVLLNTSFNDRGEPIIETPLEALKFFLTSDLDVLFIHNYMFRKK